MRDNKITIKIFVTKMHTSEAKTGKVEIKSHKLS
jgi:hypothetical protein